MQWKFSGSMPVYRQIIDQIRSAIVAGDYRPGDRIPPVRDLAAQAQVNPNTMQRALLALEREGLLVTDGTVGRYVTQDEKVLEAIKQHAVEQLVRQCAAQFRAMGLTAAEAAKRLLELEEEGL